jgi:hypothetical protein
VVLYDAWSKRGGDFANRPRAETTECTESFQPHVLEKKQILSITVTAIHQFQSRSGKKLSVHSAHSAVPHTKRYMLREPDPALPQAQPSRCARQPEGKS